MTRKPFSSFKKPKRDDAVNNIGKLGMTQAVSTFGVGSIYEMRSSSGGASMILHSVMVAGLDYWPNDATSVIREPSLARALGVDYFRRPPLEEGKAAHGKPKTIPAVRFPGVYYCDKCGSVGRVGREFSDISFGGVICGKSNCSGKGVPFRFVVACHDKQDPSQPGHIEDFPFEWWAHKNAKICSKPEIKFISSSQKSGLEGLILSCTECDESNSLAGIFSDDALAGRKCGGSRPWLGDRESDCKRHLRVLQRGASNVYFPVTASALSIPPYSERLLQLLSEVTSEGHLQTVRDQMPGALDLQVAGARNTPGLDDPELYTDQQIRDGLLMLAGVSQIHAVETEGEQKRLERNALVAGQQDDENGELFAVPVSPTTESGILERYTGRLVQVHRLREVRALRGFQRVEPTFEGDPYQLVCAPISKEPQKWLPAIEVRGEGLYFEFPPEKVAEWEQSDPVGKRIELVHKNYRDACRTAGREQGEPPSARYVLAHTLSHMLMKQLSLECGYSGSSLRERLYVLDDGPGGRCTGFLVYTASTSADGTLGGLVSQGEPETFQGMLLSAIASARWCSSDPLCMESNGQGVDGLNLAACHACALIAETSCERRNMFLDRGMVVGTMESPETGFFHNILNGLD